MNRERASRDTRTADLFEVPRPVPTTPCSMDYRATVTHWLAGIRGGRLLVGKETLMHDLARAEQLRDEADEAVRVLRARLKRG